MTLLHIEYHCKKLLSISWLASMDQKYKDQKVSEAASEQHGYSAIKGVKSSNKYYQDLIWASLPAWPDDYFHFLASSLEECQIAFNIQKFEAIFKKQFIKTDWESTTYNIKLGFFAMKLNIIETVLNPGLFETIFFNKGSFGQVSFLVETDQPKYAIKTINLSTKNQELIDTVLKEVFVAKLFSGLKIGPKFQTILSYDAIIFQDRLMFAMEACMTQYQEHMINKELQQKNLFKSLRIMHKLHICHMDIKNDNVGWSPSFNKFVFLDFNLNKVVVEDIGYTTYSFFVGSYVYSSPEMKKLYFLRSKSYVDLYFNDLYGLRLTWQGIIEEQAKYKKYFKTAPTVKGLFEVFYKNNDSQRIIRNQVLVSYLSFKFSLFVFHKTNIEQIIKNQIYILAVFLQIIQKSIQKASSYSKNYPFLTEMRQKIGGEIRMKGHTDNIAVKYIISDLLTYENQCCMDNIYKQISLISMCDSLFKKMWVVDKWKLRFFEFIDVYQNQQVTVNTRQQLLLRIYGQIKKDEDDKNILVIFRKVLLYYFEYFCGTKNLKGMQKIMGYFILLENKIQVCRMQEAILCFMKKNGSTLNYINYNMKLFLCNQIIMDGDKYTRRKVLENNLRRVLIEFDQKSEFHTFVEETIHQIHLISSLFQQRYEKVDRNQICEQVKLYLQKRRYWLDTDLLKIYQQTFLAKIISNTSINSINDIQLSQNHIASFSMQPFYFCLVVLAFTVELRNYVVSADLNLNISRQMLTKFNQHFDYHKCTNQFSLQQDKELYSKLRKLNQNKLFFIQPQQLNKLLQMHPQQFFLDFFLQFVSSLPLHQVSDINDTIYYQNVMLKILHYILRNKHIFNCGSQKAKLSKLCTVIQFYTNLITHVQPKVGEKITISESEIMPNPEQVNQISKISHLQQFIRVLIYELVGDVKQLNEAMSRIIAMHQRERNLRFYPAFYKLISCYSFSVTPSTKVSLCKAIILAATLNAEFNNKSTYLLRNPACIAMVFDSYLYLNRTSQCFPFIYKICRVFVHRVSAQISKIFNQVAFFVINKLPVQDLYNLVIKSICQKLENFSKLSFFHLLLGMAFWRSFDSRISYQFVHMRRVMLISVYFEFQLSPQLAIKIKNYFAFKKCLTQNGCFRKKVKIYRRVGYIDGVVKILEQRLKGGCNTKRVQMMESIKQKLSLGSEPEQEMKMKKIRNWYHQI